mmetsp:Transcript_28303/g.71221  ORF Transcript_28303/g.71221 Transcript_28303/m.71221 type:complete len:238 (+) Transcript_28303:925-1638(+)
MHVWRRAGCAPRRRRVDFRAPATWREQLYARGLQPPHLLLFPALDAGVVCALLLPQPDYCVRRAHARLHHVRGRFRPSRGGNRGGCCIRKHIPRANCERKVVLLLSYGRVRGDSLGIARTDGRRVAAPARARGRRVHRGWHTLHMPVHFGRRFGWPLPRARGPPRAPAVAPGRDRRLQSARVCNRMRNALEKRNAQRARTHRLDQSRRQLPSRETGSGRWRRCVTCAASRLWVTARA